MRLICGLIRLDGAPADSVQLDRMVAALAAPGRPAPRTARHVDGPAALAVLDFAAAPSLSPLPTGADGTVLAADLRLDRAARLSMTLGLPPDASPEIVALSALARWGSDLPDRLDGDFALAAWDGARRRLVLARDIMGVRPLCWTCRPGRLLAFASLPRGLHASGLVTPRLEALALGRLLVETTWHGAATGLADIAWLPAGHSLQADGDGIRLHRAWRPEPAQVGTWRGSAADAAAELRGLVEDAVHTRLPAAGPVAAHLSGGLDSSAVAVIAARRLRDQGRHLHAFSRLAAPGRVHGLRDEDEYVAAVLAQEPDMVWSPIHAEPFLSPATGEPDLDLAAPVATDDDRICAAAAMAGAELLLSGGGGDEGATYNGAGLYAAMLRHGRWRGLARELRARARREGETLATAITYRLVAPLLPHWLRRHRVAANTRPPALDFLAPPLAAQVAETLVRQPDWRNRPEDRIAMLADSFVAGRNTWWATAGARHGIAFACPLLDRRIIDFALSLPLERFVHNGHARQPFRDAMTGILPDAVRLRPGKFIIHPDLPVVLAESKAALLARLHRLRPHPHLHELFDLDAIAAALADIAEGDEAVRDARALNGPAPPPALRHRMQALRALKLAEQAARLL